MAKNNVVISDILIGNTMNEGNEFIPIIADGEDDSLDIGIPEELPILPLRNTVLFPGIVIPITVGREKSIKLIREAYKNDKIIGTKTKSQRSDDGQPGAYPEKQQRNIKPDQVKKYKIYGSPVIQVCYRID